MAKQSRTPLTTTPDYEPFLQLDLRDGETSITCWHESQGSGRPPEQYYGIIREYPLSQVVFREEVLGLIEGELAPMLERVFSGGRVEYDGHGDRRIGVLDDDALAAENEIQEILDGAGASVEDERALITPGEWFENVPAECAGRSDAELYEMADRELDEGLEDGWIMDETEMTDYLEWQRDNGDNLER